VSFVLGRQIAIGPYPKALAAGDFNRDGNLDALPTFTRGMQLLLGYGDGSFQPANQLDATLRTHGAWTAVADFNNDGKPDIAVLGSTARHLDIYLNTSGAAS
jgi:FG-GAP-like repeat